MKSPIRKHVHGFGALRYAHITKNKKLLRQLEERFLPIFGPERRLQPLPDHVDHTVFGTIPLQLYAQTGKEIYYHMGMWYADEQWKMPRNTKHREAYQALLDQGLSWQTRYWIDDMFMISAIQSQAYFVTKDRKYIDRAAAEMVKYLDKIQRPNGLFYHAEDVPFFWGRGNGWMAAGMTELLGMLPEDNPNRERILESYRRMMNSLRDYQKEDGLWGQLVGRQNYLDGNLRFGHVRICHGKRRKEGLAGRSNLCTTGTQSMDCSDRAH